jgi:SAM-dependent methyltransferase
MTATQNVWTEDDSRVYREVAAVAVPDRAEQMAALLTLLPFGRDESFRAVELACGEGRLTYSLLDCFPRASAVALDGSEDMRGHATALLRPFGSRAEVAPFELSASDWHARLDGAGCVLCSLSVHHLSGEEKRRLFAAVAQRLAPRSALLIADLVAPQRPEARELFAATWDRSAQERSLALTGSTRAYERFLDTKWNYYRYPDPYDQPSPLFEQLTWLRQAGFGAVDCFWLRAGHAIYGGYKGQPSPSTDTVRYESALATARKALGVSVGHES